MRLEDHQEMVRDTAREFAENELKPHAAKWDTHHTFPAEAIAGLGELGFGAFCLTEPQAGSDASALRTRAVRDGDHWIINGAKQFITSGSEGDIAIVFAVTDPKAGKRGISAFIVPTDTPGYVVSRIEEKLGQNASDTCQITFVECRVPVENMLGAEGQGYKIALANLEGGRIGIASQSVGMARAAFEAARDYANERETFGKKIIDHQAVAFRLADMATKIDAARLLVGRLRSHAGWQFEAIQPLFHRFFNGSVNFVWEVVRQCVFEF